MLPFLPLYSYVGCCIRELERIIMREVMISRVWYSLISQLDLFRHEIIPQFLLGEIACYPN